MVRESSVDVLVIGAGPTGLAMSAELARFGVGHRIIDNGPQATAPASELVLSPFTLEQFARYGIAEHATEHDRTLSFDEAQALLSEAAAHGGAVVERGVRVLHLDDEGESSRVELEVADKSLEVARCGFVVECEAADVARDGARWSEGRRVFFAGDAARTHAPAEGSDANIGIQDAGNLGWKLALAKTRRASSSLLDSYALERESADASAHATASDYEKSPIVSDCGGDTTLRAGARAPDGIITTDHTRSRLFDLFAMRPHTLLCGDRNEVTEAIAPALAPYSGLVHVVAVRVGDDAYERAYGSPASDAIWIVRPDGYVGFRGHANDTRALEAWLRSTFA
jgi:hypothetical protein